MPDDFPVDHLPDQRAPAPIPDAAALPVAQLIEWRPWVRSADSRLAGHCAIEFSGGWCISKIPIFRDRTGALSAGSPAVPELDGAGCARTRPDGTRLYVPILTFSSAAAKLRWQRVVMATLAAAGVVP